MVATTLDVTLLMHTHREAATTELELLHEELMNLHIECGNTEETEGPFRYSPTLKEGPAATGTMDTLSQLSNH